MVGIACSCSTKDSRLPENVNYVCYIVSATSLREKYVVENLPAIQSFLKGNQECRTKCTNHFGELGFNTNPNHCYMSSDADSKETDGVVDTNGYCRNIGEVYT